MVAKLRKIEIDAETADALEARAAERGVSVGELIADWISNLAAHANVPQAATADEIAELDRRWAKVAAGEATNAGIEVVRWLRTWGTPAFRPWHDQ